MVNLQPLDLLVDRRAAGQQRRHDDDGAQIRGHAVAKFEPGQKCRAPTFWVMARLTSATATSDAGTAPRIASSRASNRRAQHRACANQAESEDDGGDERDHPDIAAYADCRIGAKTVAVRSGTRNPNRFSKARRPFAMR